MKMKKKIIEILQKHLTEDYSMYDTLTVYQVDDEFEAIAKDIEDLYNPIKSHYKDDLDDVIQKVRDDFRKDPQKYCTLYTLTNENKRLDE